MSKTETVNQRPIYKPDVRLEDSSSDQACTMNIASKEFKKLFRASSSGKPMSDSFEYIDEPVSLNKTQNVAPTRLRYKIFAPLSAVDTSYGKAVRPMVFNGDDVGATFSSIVRREHVQGRKKRTRTKTKPASQEHLSMPVLPRRSDESRNLTSTTADGNWQPESSESSQESLVDGGRFRESINTRAEHPVEPKVREEASTRDSLPQIMPISPISLSSQVSQESLSLKSQTPRSQIMSLPSVQTPDLLYADQGLDLPRFGHSRAYSSDQQCLALSEQDQITRDIELLLQLNKLAPQYVSH